MRSKQLSLLLLLIVALLLAACGGSAGNSGDEEPRNNDNGGNALEPVDNEDLPTNDNGQPLPEGDGGDVITEEPLVDNATPPPAILIVGEAEQESGVGTYCWQDPANNTAVCADMIGIPSPVNPLLVDSPLTARFHFAIEDAPDQVQLGVVAVTDDMLAPFSDEETVWWEAYDAEWQNYELPLSNDVTHELALEPGQYLLSLFVRWDNYGDVTYGFLIEVTAAAADAGSGGGSDGDGRMTLAGYIQAAIANRDFDALAGTMADPFNVALWASEGVSYAPADAAAALESTYLLPDNVIAFMDAPSMGGLVPDGDVRNVWSPDHEIVEVLFSTGWGPDGAGEAFLFLVEHEGGLYWDGMLYAPEGFPVE